MPSPQSLPSAEKIFLFLLNDFESISRGTLTPHSCHPSASCPLYSGASGKNLHSIGLTVFFGYLLIFLCRGNFNHLAYTGWGAGLSRQPRSSQGHGRQHTAVLLHLPHPSVPLPAPSLPCAAKASLCPFIFEYFCCNLMLISFQIPQIRDCESNAGSY